MLRKHNTKFRQSGCHELLSGAMLERELEKLKYGQANSRTRCRRKAAMSRSEVSVNVEAMETTTMTSTSMQCPAVEDLILDNEQWQGLVYTIAGETSVANCLRTDLD